MLLVCNTSSWGSSKPLEHVYTNKVIFFKNVTYALLALLLIFFLVLVCILQNGRASFDQPLDQHYIIVDHG